MKCFWFVLALLFVGLMSCAPTVSQADQAPTLARPGDTPTTKPTTMPAPTDTPDLTPPATQSEASPTTILRVESPATELEADPPTPPATATPTPTLEVRPTATDPTTPTVLAVEGAKTEELAEKGLQVYKQLYCGLCHQLEAAGTAGTFGPPHNGMGTIAAQRIQEPHYTGKATTAAEYLHESIVDPKAFRVPGFETTQHQMPVYNFLSEPDVEALVQMLLQQ
jgi:mono/diheme cytochrome c family protein